MLNDIKKLFREIPKGMSQDRDTFRRRLHLLEQKANSGENVSSEWISLKEKITLSQKNREKRLQNLPIPTYPDHLPVAQERHKIAQTIQNHPVTILSGQTGSGKTTQLPKICLDLKRGTRGWIGITQPRRIAAHSIAGFLAEDLKSELGKHVGYKMRFDGQVNTNSIIKVMTDGILLAEIQGDKTLSQYDTLIIDEAHERSLNIDFLLGFLKQLSPKRPDLKIIISSATLDTQRFSKHFNNAPVIEVLGRTFPVKTLYRPLKGDEEREEKEEKDLEEGIWEAIEELFSLDTPGDVLVFLPGEREIREVADYLRKHPFSNTEVLSLFARLSIANQNRIFHPGALRRIILATNVAETSITVPGIRYVVDSGLARISRHSGHSQVKRLPIEKIAQSSANQRKGRCGRLSDGICIRLYSEKDFLERTVFTDPEIVRTSLASVILKMKFSKLGAIEQFPFVDIPSSTAIKHGFRLLAELSAVTEKGDLTPIGRDLARLPVDPRLGRMILAGHKNLCLKEILIIASALSVPDPREWPEDKKAKSEMAHKKYVDIQSDFMSILKLWSFIQTLKDQSSSKNQFRQRLKNSFLSFIRVREWQNIFEQLQTMTKDMGYKPSRIEANYSEIHKALLSGLLGHIGFKSEKHDYTGARQNRFFINPGSVLFKKSPPWIIAAELVETTRIFARTCARVEPEWIEQVAGPLCHKSYFDPHWEKKSSIVKGFEKVTLFGLILIPKRQIHYGPIDPLESRKLFIQSALIEGHFNTKAVFFEHNQSLVREIRELEHKSRRRDLLVDERDLIDFYEERIPEDIYTGHQFHRWYRESSKKNPQFLFFNREMVMRHDGMGINADRFPGFLQVDGREIALEYHFNPGQGEDGISALIPLLHLNQLTSSHFEWLVPGLLQDKLLALLKSLPKSLRRSLVPLPQSSQRCWTLLQNTTRDKPLAWALSEVLQHHFSLTVPVNEWQLDTLPDHLRCNFKVVDEKTGRVVLQGKDLDQLQKHLVSDIKQSFKKLAKPDFERTGLSQWDFGTLPEKVPLSNTLSNNKSDKEHAIYGYPAIQDEGSKVSLRLLESLSQAQQTSRWGLVRLFKLQLSSPIRHLEKSLTITPAMSMAYAPLKGEDSLKEEIITLTVLHLFMDEKEPSITEESQFQQRLQSGRKNLVSQAEKFYKLIARILESYNLVNKQLKTMNAPSLTKTRQEIKNHLDSLLFRGFLRTTPKEWLHHFPRYLKAIQLRLERRSLDPLKDQKKAEQIIPLFKTYQTLTKKQSASQIEDPNLKHYRWMLEEYRVSLFAQELKTSLIVSDKRLTLQWQKVLQ